MQNEREMTSEPEKKVSTPAKPSAKSKKDKKSEKPRKRRRGGRKVAFIAGAAAVLMLLGTGLGVGLSMGMGQGNESAPVSAEVYEDATAAPTEQPVSATAAPTPEPLPDPNAVPELVITVSGGEIAYKGAVVTADELEALLQADIAAEGIGQLRIIDVKAIKETYDAAYAVLENAGLPIVEE